MGNFTDLGSGNMSAGEADLLVQREARLGAEMSRREDITSASESMSKKILDEGDVSGAEKVILAALFNELSGPRPMFRMKAADLLMEAFSLKGKNRKKSDAAEESLGRLKAVLEKISVLGDGGTETHRIEIEEA